MRLGFTEIISKGKLYLITEVEVFRVALHLEGGVEVREALFAGRQVAQVYAPLLVNVDVADHVVHCLQQN
jgi:hypothetical protein